MAFVGKYTCHKLQVIIWQLKHWDPFPQLTGWLLPFKLSTKRFWYLVRLLKNLDFIIRHGEMRPTIWTDRLTITISKLLQLPNAVGKSFHASSDHWSQLLLAPSTEAVFESHHPVRLLSRSSAFRKRSNLMNSRIRLVFMSLTLLTSQCPLIRTYCSTLEFSWRSPKDWPRPCCCSPLPTPVSWCQLWPRGRPPTPRRCCPTSSFSSALRTSASSPPPWEPTWSSCLQPRTACGERGLDV